MPKDHELFAPAYAFDVLLPVISLGSKADWKARLTGDNHEPLYWGWALQFFTWALAFVGWVSGLMLVVVLGGLVKKDCCIHARSVSADGNVSVFQARALGRDRKSKRLYFSHHCASRVPTSV